MRDKETSKQGSTVIKKGKKVKPSLGPMRKRKWTGSDSDDLIGGSVCFQDFRSSDYRLTIDG